MRKRVFGRKFKRDANERRALLNGLMNDLVLKGSIKTTEQKAKAIKGSVEKLVTKAKRQGEKAERLLQPYLTPAAVEKVINDLAVRFANRPGGYVRIIKLGERFGDNASMAVIEWVEKTATVVEKAAKTVKVAAEKADNGSANLVPSREVKAKTVKKAPVKKAAAKPVKKSQGKGAK